MNIAESLGPNAATLGGGFIVSLLIGYALKKVNQSSKGNIWILSSWIGISSI